MYEPLVSGGTVRRLWIGEAELYGQHLLRPESVRAMATPLWEYDGRNGLPPLSR